ncbi:Transposon Ty3-I Gag-Pol polyprotein [Trichinella pseudospiralis]|uniref:RNA-directed DNA polymerase n=1 Tax=Trichinella pseudospiralis TaxID=6337 RepID=A0A0V1FAP4_TRIPS|nr:Transposon Ty3-I Gag-Pol polyprotein [Trichinella pseudospiralis]
MLGYIEEFDISKPKEWTAYASRLTFFLEANNVTDSAKRRAVLLSSCGGAVFNLIQALISPANPNEKSFDEILFVLEEHFSRRPSEIVKRNAFYKRNQKIGESISDFVADLRRLAQGCNFSDLEIMLRDRLGIGLRDEELQLRLFSRKNLTFESALEEALSAEAAAQHTREVRASDNTSSNVYQIQAKTAKPATICQSCGGTHIRSQCRFRNACCRACQKVGHIAKVCRSFSDSLLLNNLRASAKHDQSGMSSRKIRITVVIENFPCEMEIDTGSEYTVLFEYVFRKLSQGIKIRLEPITVKLATFQGELVKVKGSCSVNVQYGNIHRTLALIVAKGHCPNLLGLNWFEPLGIHLSGVHHELGMYVGKPVSLDLDPNVTSICMKARKVPFALREKIDAELDKLVEQGVLEPVDHPVWSTPIVTPVKPDGTVRICGDYKCTINKALRKHAYLIPAVNQLLASLSGGKVFAKLDLAQAYQQLTVDDATAGAAAPGIFQNVIDKTVAGIQGVLPYFDDILIAASDEKELANRLETVLHRFAKAGLRLKSDKCKFCLPHVEFLGFEVDATGIHPAKAKVQAIHDAPTPKNKQQLQAFLGFLNFYHSLLKNKATVAEPLHRLLDKNARWTWTGKHEKAFKDVKRLLSVLTHYDGKKPLVLVCDASPHGIGSVLCHKLSSTQEIPIAFYSRTLSATERIYAQIDKEALAITNHCWDCSCQRRKPRIYLLLPRMLRWSILLNAYDYTINYRPGKEIANADALSRLPKQSTENNDPQNSVILFLETIDNFPLHSKDIARITAKDPILTRILSWAWRGWPKSVSDERLKPYVTRQHEISIHNGRLLWSSRVIIPLQARHKILKELHIGHPGIEQMKALARSYVWWPKMDSEIENLVRTCELCQQSRASPPHAPVHKWESPRILWTRIHVNLAGPIYGKNFLIVVDSFSKWLEVRQLKNTTSESVISCLRQIFSIHGLPDIIGSDNGTQFTSHTFQEYLNKGGIRHITSAPFHPFSNGQAERMVRTTKEFIKKMTQRDWEYNLANFLFCQHVTPSTTTGKSPAELLMNRRLRTDYNQTSYRVTHTEDGQLWRRHIDQLRKRYVTTEQNHSAEKDESQEDETAERTVEAIPEEHTAVATTPREETAAASSSPASESVGQQRSSTRKRRPPQWLRDYES